METVDQCPLCAHSTSHPFAEIVFHDRTVSNRICSRCGLVFQSPRMSAAEREFFYEGEYRRLYQGQEEPIPKDIATQSKRARSLLAFLDGRVENIGRHLDIGCSAGILLQSVRERYGADIVGVEPGNLYRDYAARHGIDVFPSLDALRETSPASFDFISMAHVLEHLPDPVGTLVDLRHNYLKPQGRLLLEVPNLYGHDSFEIAHLLAFSSHTLRQVLARAGYDVLTMQTHGRPRSRLIPLYISVLACPGDNPAKQVVPERFVAYKRRLGMFYRRIATRLSPSSAWLPVE